MKNKFLISVLLIWNSIVHGQLDRALTNLTQQLTELHNALQPTTLPILEIPKPPPKQLTWAAFIEENNTRKQKADQDQYPDFSGTIQVTLNSQYQTVEPLQQALSAENKTCVQFYPGSQMHMTMLYAHFPMEPNQYANEYTMVGTLNDYLENITKSYISILKPMVFNFEKIEIIGKDKNFLVALYNPTQKKSDYQNNFVLKLGTNIFKDYPHAWFEFIEDPRFHISLGKLKPDCTALNIKMPTTTPKVKPFELKKGNLRVSIKGPSTKPYFKKVAGW